MSDTETQTHQPDSTAQDPTRPTPPPAAAQFSIWPPSQRTRDAVTKRLIDTLSTPSVLSKRYGTMTHDEASAMAHRIEEEAFEAANAGSAGTEEDGIEILHGYSKEISKRMLEAVKAKASANDAAPDTAPSAGDAGDGAATETETATESENVSSVEN